VETLRRPPSAIREGAAFTRRKLRAERTDPTPQTFVDERIS
jgi:hypothetical protein